MVQKRPRKGSPKTLSELGDDGTRLEELMAMKLILAKRIDAPDTATHALARLVSEHMKLSEEIEGLRVRDREHLRLVEGDAGDVAWHPDGI